MLPGDPLVLYLGAAIDVVTPKMLAEARIEYGLDKSLPEQYFNWIGGIFRGDMGKSIHFKKPVTTLLTERVPKTLEITFFSIVIGAFSELHSELSVQ